MGNIYIALKAVFEELGVEVIPPPKCSKNTLEIGTKHSPELICIPFKITVGNYIESIKRGADTLFMWGGCDVCRIGFYNTLQKEILRNLGYPIELICVEPFKNIKEINNFLQKLQRISGTKNYLKIFAAFVKGIKLLNEVDDFDALVHKIRPREVSKGEVDQLYDKFEKEMYLARGYKEITIIIKKYKEALKNIQINEKRDILKIGIVGEIYTVVEPFINLDIIKRLGNMGVEVHRSVVSSEFINEQLDFIPFIHSEKEEVHRAAKNYLDTEIGGHARHTIGNTVRYAQEHYDGVIHLLPFTCMPEIVASSILPTIKKEKDIPILKIILDEMTGEVGYFTRIEAFVDLLERRRMYRKIV
jgi:predicted nucleotide-binding protein (sugar kinase/HSP70/actin superfamily)